MTPSAYLTLRSKFYILFKLSPDKKPPKCTVLSCSGACSAVGLALDTKAYQFFFLFLRQKVSQSLTSWVRQQKNTYLYSIHMAFTWWRGEERTDIEKDFFSSKLFLTQFGWTSEKSKWSDWLPMLWQYGLWSFQARDAKLDRFLAKNQL